MGEGTGEANALYWLRRGEHVWVLRLLLAVINAPGASDMNREWRILVALDGTSVPHPAPLLLGGPDGPLGTPFLIMARVDGFTPVGLLSAPYDHSRGRRDLAFALVLNGEKWFSSSASISDYALVMARTDAGAPRHRQFTTFVVELPDPGYQIIRDIPTLHEAVGTSPGGHAEVRIRDLRVPHANVIGEVGGGFAMGQHRLGYGRLRHGMWSIAKAQRALDMAAAHALERETFGQILADRQGVQWMLARQCVMP